MAELQNIEAYEAIIAAFSLISYADGHVHTAELSKLIRTLEDEPPFDKISEERLMEDVAAFVKILSRDFEAGKIQALTRIAKIKSDTHTKNLVLKIARTVLIADNKIQESEEAMLGEIHHVLGASE